MDFNQDINQKLNKGEIAIGLDLTDTYSQISYGYIEDSEEVETLSYVAGGSNYLIPTVLFKRREVNQWYAGYEAVKNVDMDGILVDHILTRARNEEMITVGDESFKPASLIALYIKRILAMVNIVAPITRIGSFMITVDTLDDKMVELLSNAVSLLGLKTKNVFFQSHMESFYFYTIFQPQELWMHEVLLLDFSTESLKSFRMECNKNTTPIVAFIDPNSYSGFKTAELNDIIPGTEEARLKDEELSKLIADAAGNRLFSSIYFIGENFNTEIFKESVKAMARRGRLFEGNNLYSKGAAYSARNKIVKSILSESHVFLGNDKLKSNVGINVLKRGVNAYMALLDAGINWFEAKRECDIILNQGNRLSFVVTPLTGKNPRVVDVTLGDLPKRPAKTSRLHLSIKMISETRMQVNIKDCGFGELFPATSLEWNEVIDV